MTTSCLARYVLIIFFLVACCVSGCSHRDVDPKSLDQQLLKAAGNQDAAAVELLLRQGAKVGATNERGATALDEAALQGNSAVVALLLGTNIDTRSKNEALFWAAGSEPLVATRSQQKMLEHDPKFAPFDKNYADVARLLLDKGADIEAVNEEYDTPLIQAAAHGGTAMVKLLLERGASIEARDGLGLTALNAAACVCAVVDMPDTLDIARMLLEKGANIETRDDAGNTPLIRAARWGRTEIVKLLLEKRANIEARNNDGDTALLVSAEGGAMPTAETVKVLLERGSQIEAKNKEGKTPLILAASENGFEQIEVVRLLLKQGANIRAKDNHGNTALSWAEKGEHPDAQGSHSELLKLLKTAMAASR